MWLTKAFLPTAEPKYIGKRVMSLCRNPLLLKKVKKIIEREYCESKSAVVNLYPEEIRLLHQGPQRAEVLDMEDPEDALLEERKKSEAEES